MSTKTPRLVLVERKRDYLQDCPAVRSAVEALRVKKGIDSTVWKSIKRAGNVQGSFVPPKGTQQ